MNFFNQFRLNIQYIIFYMVDFIIILFVLQKFLFKKIANVLNERESIIKKGLEDAKESQEKKEEMEERYKEIMKETQREVDQILKGTRVSAEKLRDEIINTSEIEAKKIIEEAENKISQDHDKMYELLKNEVKRIAIDITEKVLDENLGREERDIILKKSIKYLENEK